ETLGAGADAVGARAGPTRERCFRAGPRLRARAAVGPVEPDARSPLRAGRARAADGADGLRAVLAKPESEVVSLVGGAFDLDVVRRPGIRLAGDRRGQRGQRQDEERRNGQCLTSVTSNSGTEFDSHGFTPRFSGIGGRPQTAPEALATE